MPVSYMKTPSELELCRADTVSWISVDGEDKVVVGPVVMAPFVVVATVVVVVVVAAVVVVVALCVVVAAVVAVVVAAVVAVLVVVLVVLPPQTQGPPSPQGHCPEAK